MEPVISQAEAIRRMEERKPFIILIMLGLCVAVVVGLLSMCSNPSGSKHQASNMSREQILLQSRTKFQAGDGFGALAVINDNATPEMLQTDAEVRALQRTIIAKMDEDIGPQRAEAVAERLSGYWTAQVNEASTGTASTVPEIMNREMVFQDAARALQEASEFKEDQQVRDAAGKFGRLLRTRQAAAFPSLRKAYKDLIAAAMWRHDVTVANTSRRIRFTGGLFAANANIGDAQDTLKFNLTHLRFSKSEYAWHKGSDVSSYDLDTPADTVVGYWDGGNFIEVTASAN